MKREYFKGLIYAAMFGTWVAAVILGMAHQQYGMVAIAMALAFLDYTPEKKK